MKPNRPQPQTLPEYLDGPPRISQRKLARRLHVTQPTISMIVRGRRRPRASLALRLHKLTGVPLEALLAPRRVRKRGPPPVRRSRTPRG